jgi:hypothetical protein
MSDAEALGERCTNEPLFRNLLRTGMSVLGLLDTSILPLDSDVRIRIPTVGNAVCINLPAWRYASIPFTLQDR